MLGNQGVQRARSQKEVLPSVTRLDVEEVIYFLVPVKLQLLLVAVVAIKGNVQTFSLGKRMTVLQTL